MLTSIVRLVITGLRSLRALFQSHRELALENLALRQQLAIYDQKKPRPRMSAPDKAFWMFMSDSWYRWNALHVSWDLRVELHPSAYEDLVWARAGE